MANLTIKYVIAIGPFFFVFCFVIQHMCDFFFFFFFLTKIKKKKKNKKKTHPQYAHLLFKGVLQNKFPTNNKNEGIHN